MNSSLKPKRATKIFSGALIATSAAALSTIFYLYLSKDEFWAARFIQIYTLTSMISGWLNTAVMQVGPRGTYTQGKSFSLFILAAATGFAVLLFNLLFSENLLPQEVLMMAALLVPVLYSTAYSKAFALGKTNWAYMRATIFNALYFLGAILSLILGGTYQDLYLGILLSGSLVATCFIVDRSPVYSPSRNRPDIPAAILNPSLPTLERSAWDQWMLHKLSLEGDSWGLYLAARVVTFTGNVFFSFLIGSQINEANALLIKGKVFLFLIFFNLVLLLASLASGQSIAFLIFGNISAWQMSLLLALFYQGKNRLPYYLVASVWLTTVPTRALIWLNWPEIFSYSLAQAIMSYSALAAICALLKFSWGENK